MRNYIVRGNRTAVVIEIRKESYHAVFFILKNHLTTFPSRKGLAPKAIQLSALYQGGIPHSQLRTRRLGNCNYFMTKKQARNQRNQRTKAVKLWSSLSDTPKAASGGFIACGNGESMTVWDENGRQDFSATNEEAAELITAKVAEMVK